MADMRTVGADVSAKSSEPTTAPAFSDTSHEPRMASNADAVPKPWPVRVADVPPKSTPDGLAPAAIEAKAEEIAQAKTAMPVSRTLILAVFAGMFVAFGAVFFTCVAGDTALPFAAQRLAGGLCFALGLQLVVLCGAELFTGNMLMVCAWGSQRVKPAAVLRNWALVYVGNLLGSLLVVFLVFMADTQAMNAGGMGTAMVGIAAGKVTPDFWTLFFKGILCNILVCLAVWIGFGARTFADKILGLLLPIAAFTACGFEHCVANMYFLPMGLACKAAGYGTAAAVEALTLSGVLTNLAAVTLGNMVGGIVFVGIGYWMCYRARTS